MKTLSKTKYLEGLKKMNGEERISQEASTKQKGFKRHEIIVTVPRNQMSPPFKEEAYSLVIRRS